jgi:hypothetical protein
MPPRFPPSTRPMFHYNSFREKEKTRTEGERFSPGVLTTRVWFDLVA